MEARMTLENSQIAERLAKLEARYRMLRCTCLAEMIVFIAIAGGMLMGGRVHGNDASTHTLRVRGLVVEDAEGRPRILLGAPKAVGRKRQDEGSNALVFLNEDGADRLLVGEGNDPQIAGKVYSKEKRAMVGSGYGISIMDGVGNERGGFGFTAFTGGGGRRSIALDRPIGDAWGAWVDDKNGWAGMTFNYPIPFAEYQPGIEIGVMGERPFLHFKDKEDNARAEISLAKDGTPSFDVSDSKGRELGEVLQPVKK
jgi:hypothetical protein